MSTFLVTLVLAFLAFLWFLYRQKLANKPQDTAPVPEMKQKTNPIDHTMQFMNARVEKSTQARMRADDWARKWGDARMPVIDAMEGREFEAYLDGLFTAMGYLVEQTPATGDFGGDLILTRNDRRVVVQAKRWQGTVGVDAVQEALAGKSFYGCDYAWVVTNSTFTTKANVLALKAGVSLLDRNDLSKMIGKLQGEMKHG